MSTEKYKVSKKVILQEIATKEVNDAAKKKLKKVRKQISALQACWYVYKVWILRARIA